MSLRWVSKGLAFTLAIVLATGVYANAEGASASRAHLHSPLRADASGTVTIHWAHRRPTVAVRVADLPSPGHGYAYALWLGRSAQRGTPIAPLDPIPRRGDYADRFYVSSALKPVLKDARVAQAELCKVKTLRHRLHRQIRTGDRVIDRIGRTALQGRFRARG